MAIQQLKFDPPTPYLKVLSDHYCTLISIYIYIWENKNNNNLFHIKKSEISEKTLFEKKTFMTSLRKICREGLCSFKENKDSLEIELTDWSQIDEDFE